MSGPLVSCILPTYNRRRFLSQAIRCFQRRTYANAELIVLDDSDRSCASLCRGIDAVRYIRLDLPITTGAKLNLGIAAARGDILQKIDDDDYYGPRFLESSVSHCLAAGPAAIVTRCCFLTLIGRDGVLRHSRHNWSVGGALCFHRALWKRIPFQNSNQSQDSQFLRDHNCEIVRICDPEQYIVIRHGANNWQFVKERGAPKKVLTDDYLRDNPPYHKPLRDVLPESDIAFYGRVLRWNSRQLV